MRTNYLLVTWLVVLYDYPDDAYTDSLMLDAEGMAIAAAMDDVADELEAMGFSPSGEVLG